MTVQVRRNVQKEYITLLRAEYVSVLSSLLFVEITKIFMKAVERNEKKLITTSSASSVTYSFDSVDTSINVRSRLMNWRRYRQDNIYLTVQ